jgi:hypothetical protein
MSRFKIFVTTDDTLWRISIVQTWFITGRQSSDQFKWQHAFVSRGYTSLPMLSSVFNGVLGFQVFLMGFSLFWPIFKDNEQTWWPGARKTSFLNGPSLLSFKSITYIRINKKYIFFFIFSVKTTKTSSTFELKKYYYYI